MGDRCIGGLFSKRMKVCTGAPLWIRLPYFLIGNRTGDPLKIQIYFVLTDKNGKISQLPNLRANRM